MFKIHAVSSLEKVFAADTEYSPAAFDGFSMLKGETSAFQVTAWFEPDEALPFLGDPTFELVSDISDLCTVSLVEETPADIPAPAVHDGDFLSDKPGLFPDLLVPFTTADKQFPFPGFRWRVLWVDVEVPEDAKAGSYDVTVILKNDGKELGRATVTIKIIDAVLPEQTLKYINWFHCDCLASYYKVPLLGEEHWVLIENYIRTAVKYGLNFLLTPIFTPPLDTAVGGERPTVQLIDVTVTDGVYSFGFEKFERFVRMAQRCGIKYFEISHLFTQWGANHAPKVMATVDGEYKRIFGWDTAAVGEEYTAFLTALAPALIAETDRLGIRDICYFHVSDEPSLDHLEQYGKAANLAHKLFEGFNFIDALSNVDFYDTGLVHIPIPATNHVATFLERDLPERWTYYCCGQYMGTSNRFLAMPSRRNRILGLQLYKYSMDGFLQWGYNFWYSVHSKTLIDPFRVTDGRMVWPAGDPFVVYPGADGTPLISLRLKVFHDGFEDMRACQLLESLIGREAVVALIDEELDEPLTFTNGYQCSTKLLEKREKINALIEQNL